MRLAAQTQEYERGSGDISKVNERIGRFRWVGACRTNPEGSEREPMVFGDSDESAERKCQSAVKSINEGNGTGRGMESG